MKNNIITFSLSDYKKEIKKYKTNLYHVSIDGENETVTLKRIKQ